MHILAVISQKGGCGKSTISVHMAVCAALLGRRTALFDFDKQASAFKWNLSRPENIRLDAVQVTEADLIGRLEQAKQAGFDLVVLDTAPHSDSAAAFAAEVADFVLIPCRPARFDMDAIPSTVHLADLTNTPTAVVLNAAPRGKIVDEARETLEALGIDVLPTVLQQRAAYSHAVIDGRAVHEYEPQGKAAEEMASLYKDLMPYITTQTAKRKKSA